MITEIIAAGAMGVSVFFAVRAHGLLKTEQAKDNPRPAFLRSIYVFMGFALLMTPVALGIEYARHRMNLDTTVNDRVALAGKLKALENEGHYALNKNGNPVAIELTSGDVTYQLAMPFPETAFRNTELQLRKDADGKYLAVKDNNGVETTYGYFPARTLKSGLSELFPAAPAPPPPGKTEASEADIENLYAAGMAYTPRKVKSQLNLKQIADQNKANRRLIEFLSAQGFENESLREGAVKLLMQPRMLDKLSEKGHDQLIELLSNNDVRTAPWRYYEAAQVYLSRYHLREDSVANDLEQHLKLSREYLRAFKKKRWTAESHPGEYAYYKSAALALGHTLGCDTCLLEESVRLK